MNLLHARTVACAMFGALFASCLDPTEIVLVVSTDVACSDVSQHGIAVAIGAPNDDTTVASGSTRDCSSDGGIGTLTVLPHGVSDAVGIRVMLGVDASVEDCDVAHGFAGCIVARRALRFDPHHPLRLPIELQGACLGQQCTPDSTCFNGSCVDASVACTGVSCDLPDAGPPPPPPNCVPVAEKVVEADALAYTPHITKIPSGYLLTWIGSTSFLYATTLDPLGTPGPLITLLKLTGPDATTGPIGSDGVTYVTFLYDAASSAPLLTIYGQLGGTVSTTATVAGPPPTDGVLRDDGGIYESLLTFQTATNLFSISPGAVVAPLTPFSNLDLTSAFEFGLVRAGATTFVGYAQTTTQCHVAACTSGTCNAVLDQTCTQVRVAASSPGSWAAVMTTSLQTLLVWSNGGVASAQLNTTPPQPQAILPMITNAGPFGFVLDATETLVRYTMPPTTPFTVASPLGFGTKAGGKGAGFDGVADDPASNAGQALVYFRSGGAGGNIPGAGSIYFTHLCQ